MRHTPLSIALALFTTVPSAVAQDWAHWRGPRYDGSTTVTGLATDFSKTAGVDWAADLPGPGAGTPIVLGSRVFVPSVDTEAEGLVALCFDRETGELRWRDAAGSGYRPGDTGSKVRLHDRSNYASPSPVAGDGRVVFFFGNGDLVTYDLDGERLWARNLQRDHGDFAFQWTFSASPTLWDGRLFVQILQRDTAVHGRGGEKAQSFLLALDPATGETLYRAERPTSAIVESRESYATPIPYVSEGREELLIAGGDVLTGHDPATGRELWRWGTWNPGNRQQWWRLVPSPVVGGGVVLACAPKREPVYAIRLGGEGELGEKGLAWKSEGRPNPVSSDVPTPLFYDDRFFVLSDVHESLSRVHPETGAVDWTVELPGKHRWRASPTGTDGKVWCMNHAGDVVIVDAGTGAIVNRVEMGEEDDDGIRATIAIAHDRAFVRTHTKLYCLGGSE